MSPTLFIFSITLYLVSMVASLVGSFFYKFIPSRLITTIIIFHFLCLIAWLVLPDYGHSLSNPGTENYLFLSFFCTGILISGTILRGEFHKLIKTYFIIFLLSLVVFIIAPSRLIGFIASGNIEAYNPDRIHISDNYFLVEQNETNIKPHPDSIYYKAVREMGMFHKTLLRDIALPRTLDSLHADKSADDKNLIIKVYSGIDITEVAIPITNEK